MNFCNDFILQYAPNQLEEFEILSSLKPDCAENVSRICILPGLIPNNDITKNPCLQLNRFISCEDDIHNPM